MYIDVHDSYIYYYYLQVALSDSYFTPRLVRLNLIKMRPIERSQFSALTYTYKIPTQLAKPIENIKCRFKRSPCMFLSSRNQFLYLMNKCL